MQESRIFGVGLEAKEQVFVRSSSEEVVLMKLQRDKKVKITKPRVLKVLEMRKSFVVFLVLVVQITVLNEDLFAEALCPGDTPCSGHGTCGAWDLCTCYRNWEGFDCSERTCPFGTAWGDVIDTSQNAHRQAHYYEECSGKGDCDRGSGRCNCYTGYEGYNCARMICPEDCSGHGTCELMNYVNSGYSGWDAEKVQVCVCDAGWEGKDCSMRMCKVGDDVLTLHQVGGNTIQSDEVQTLIIRDDGAAGTLAGEFTLTYTDWQGKDWTTYALDITTVTAVSIEEALEALPNQAIPSITVYHEGGSASGPSITFSITFSSPKNSGNQPALIANLAGCQVHGCQPVYAGITVTNDPEYVLTEVDGTEEKSVCSRRGKCNPSTGLCECFKGYMGEACEDQTIIS